ncbi:MAG: hypothetical protein GYA56_01445, partial [Geobacteraceae bacterium]|nr:hypothetical protein [Geobacteraceae bacterium]
ERFVNGASEGKPITLDNVKSFVIGTVVDSANSRYINRPIFNIKLLDEDTRLDKNLQSATTAKTQISLITDKSAASHTDQMQYDFSASVKKGGFKAQAAYSQQNKFQKSESDGTVSVKMSYSRSGAYINLITGGFSSSDDFSRYLVGKRLSTEEIKSLVDYSEEPVPGGGGKRYVAKLKIVNHGVLADKDNAYGTLQVLTEMERIFGLLKNQYTRYPNPEVRAVLKQNMLLLRKDIGDAIKDFYAYNGNAFVSSVSLMNYGLAKGELKFHVEDGNREARYGGAVSAKYSGLSFGASGSAEVQHSRSNGWAKSYKNISVEAMSVPDGTVDPTAWALTIQNMLQNEGQPISVPPVNLPPLAKLTLPDTVDPKKDPLEPPESCFSSYDDWKRYMEEKKASKDQDEKQAKAVEKKIKDQGVPKAMRKSSPVGPAAPGGQNLYQAFERELNTLKSERDGARSAKAAETASNIMRVNEMFVSGFQTTSYDTVIRQLRPNLDIPDQKEVISGYENTSTLLLCVEHLGRLDSYLRFLSHFAVTKVDPEVSERYHAFYQAFFEKVFGMISVHSENGRDVSDAMLNSFAETIFGPEGSERSGLLYEYLKDVDLCRYILTLLEPDNVKIWADAPGGYIPFGFDRKGQLGFFNLKGVSLSQEPGVGWLFEYDFDPYINPVKDPLTFYERNNTYLQSPWFPVFQYRMGGRPILVFLQLAGPYQLVYGFSSFVMPETYCKGCKNPLMFTQITPWKKDVYYSDSFIESISSPENGWNFPCPEFSQMTWNYSLFFPNSSPDPARNIRFNVLTLMSTRTNCMRGNLVFGDGYIALPMGGWFFKPFILYYSGVPKAVVWDNSTGREKDFRITAGIDDTFTLLLPVNGVTCPVLYNEAFSYSTNAGAGEMITNRTYDDVYKAAMSF